MSAIKYACGNCSAVFDLNRYIQGIINPNYCPYCGFRWKVEKTPAEIVEEIKSIYHSVPRNIASTGEEKQMEKFLNELKEMAEGNK